MVVWVGWRALRRGVPMTRCRWLWPLLLALRVGAAATVNLLPNHTGFDLGPGGWAVHAVETTARPLRAQEPARWADGALLVPTGLRLALDQPLLLAPDTLYTLAVAASTTSPGLLLRLECLGENGEFTLTESPRTYQLTFRTAARDDGLDQPAAPTLAVTAAHGLSGAARLDDLRLLPGATAGAPRDDRRLADVTWADELGAPLWLDQTPTVTLRVSPPATARARLTDLGAARGGDHAVVTERTFAASAEPLPWLLPGLEPGLYAVEVFLDTAAEPVARRLLPVLRRAAAPAVDTWSFDPAGLASAQRARDLGLAATRVVFTWAELTGPDGQPSLADLDATVALAQAAGIALTVALDVSPQGSLPPGLATTRGGQPDTARLLTFIGSLARRYTGLGLTWELDDLPQPSWGLGDYAEYLTRVADVLAEADPSAELVGFGAPLSTNGQWPAYQTDNAARDRWPLLAALPLHLSADLAALPEPLLDPADRALMAEPDRPLRRLYATRPAPGPLEADTAPGPWQAAARVVRHRLLTERLLGPAQWPTGWRGPDPAFEVALNLWRERVDGARVRGELDLAAGLRGLRLALPDGRMAAALWWPDDPRRLPGDYGPRGELPRLRLPNPAVRALTFFGGEIPADHAPLGFDPLLLVAPDGPTLDAWLTGARVDHWRPSAVTPRLVARDGQPGLALNLRNDTTWDLPLPLALRLRGDAHLTSAFHEPLLAPGEQSLYIPLQDWRPGTAAEVHLQAQTGAQLTDQRRGLWWWPMSDNLGTRRADGLTDDWPAEPALRASSADRLSTNPDARWDGADDAGLTLRASYGSRQIWLLAEVTDEQLVDADRLVIELNLSGTTAAEADHRLTLRPWQDNKVLVGWELKKLDGEVPALAGLADYVETNAVRFGWRELRAFDGTRTGWSAEICLPLNDKAVTELDQRRTIGLQAVLTDDDADGRPATRLVALGGPDQPELLAGVWLEATWGAGSQGLPTTLPPAPRPQRQAFDGEAGAVSPLPAPPEATGSLRYVLSGDWLRTRRLLRVTRPADGPPTRVADLPAGALSVWCRAVDTPEADHPPRVGYQSGDATPRLAAPGPGWTRLDFAPGAPATLVVDGLGAVELAELVVEPAQ